MQMRNVWLSALALLVVLASPLAAGAGHAFRQPSGTDGAIPAGTAGSRAIRSMMSGTYTVPGDYPSLTNPGGIFEALNSATLTGDVEIVITADLTAETGAIALNEMVEQPAGSNFEVLIHPGGAARTISGTSAAHTGLINLNGADRVLINGALDGGYDRNLTITNLANDGAVVWIHSTAGGNGANGNVIANCLLVGSGAAGTEAGILAGGSVFASPAEAPNSGNSIANNVVIRAKNGAYIVGATPALDQNWVIGLNTFGSSAAGDELGWGGLTVRNARALIQRNTIQGVESQPGVVTDVSGIWLAGTLDGVLVDSNRIQGIRQTNSWGGGSAGLVLGATSVASNVAVVNNFISGVTSSGSPDPASQNGHGILVKSGGGYALSFNTVLMATEQVFYDGVPAAIHITADVAPGSLQLVNNILATLQTRGTPYAIYSAAPASVFDTIDHNDYFAGPGAILGYLGGVQAALGDWQTATGQDANSIAADPLLVSTTDLHLSAATSPAVGAGVPFIAGVDIDEGPRDPVSPDIGADEFGSAAPPMRAVTSSVGTASGTISPLGMFLVADGDPYTFTLTPDAGYEIDSVGGACGGTLTGNSYEIASVTADCAVIANFRPAGGATPQISASPSSLAGTQAPNASTTRTLTIANIGGGTLNWAIAEEPARVSASQKSVAGSSVIAAVPAMLTPGVPTNLCFTARIQSQDSEYMDRVEIDLPDDWTVGAVAANSNPEANGCTNSRPPVSGMDTGNRVFWQSAGTLPTTCGAWLSSDTGTDYDFCVEVTVPSCSGSPWAAGWTLTGDGWASGPHSASGTYASLFCNAPPPVCSNPADVPWLSLSQTSGANAGGTSTPVTVGFDSTGLVDGTYNANLCVTSNDPGNGLVVVPVEMTVVNDSIFHDGFEEPSP